MVFEGFIGFLWLIAIIWAFIRIFQSDAEPIWKAIWAAIIFFFPVGGFLIWLLFSGTK